MKYDGIKVEFTPEEKRWIKRVKANKLHHKPGHGHPRTNPRTIIDILIDILHGKITKEAFPSLTLEDLHNRITPRETILYPYTMRGQRKR